MNTTYDKRMPVMTPPAEVGRMWVHNLWQQRFRLTASMRWPRHQQCPSLTSDHIVMRGEKVQKPVQDYFVNWLIHELHKTRIHSCSPKQPQRSHIAQYRWRMHFENFDFKVRRKGNPFVPLYVQSYKVERGKNDHQAREYFSKQVSRTTSPENIKVTAFKRGWTKMPKFIARKPRKNAWLESAKISKIQILSPIWDPSKIVSVENDAHPESIFSNLKLRFPDG